MLGSVALVTADSRRPVAAVALSGPAVHAVDAGGALAVRFRFEHQPDRRELCALSLVVRFDDPAIGVRDLRAATGGEGVPTSVWTMPDGACGCLVGDPGRTSPIPRSGWFDLVLDVPAARGELSGQLRVHGSASHGRIWQPGPVHAAGERAVRFSAAVPPGRRVVGAVGRWADSPSPAVRLCVAVDAERYSRFALPEAARAQQRFVHLLAEARKRAGLDEARVDVQPSGDGLFVVLPAGVDESVVIPELVEGIRAGLTDANHDLNERARLRLRVAMHRGHVAAGANGWLGSVVTTVHRLVDCEAVRRALADAPAADFALVVSDVLYRDVIADGYRPLDPDRFREVVADVPGKGFSQPAWLYVPGG